MEVITALPRLGALDIARRIDWNAVSIWLLGFGLVVYLGLEGGGYDPLVGDRVGIAVWWVLLAGVLIGAFPRRQPGPLGWCALGLLAAFVVWTALSLMWTDSPDKTSADVARVAGYLGVFSLAISIRGSRGARFMVAAVGTGIVCVSTVALLSRLHPAWFPEAEQTARFLPSAQRRLSYPLNYWNAVGALIAIGLPLMLSVATSAKSILTRAVAAGVLPAMALTLYFTLSRGGTAAGVVALAVFLVLAPDRLPKAATLFVTALGGAILIAGAAQRHDLQNGLLTSSAQHQGSELLAMTVVVCVGVALVQAGLSVALKNELRPGWAFLSRRQSIAIGVAALLAALVVGIAVDAPGRASRAWSDFKQVHNTRTGAGRLATVAGEGRYQLWRSAIKEDRSKPLTGTGSGTFEYWWARNGDLPNTVKDTHSLYMQTLGELGIIGILLLASFLLTVLIGGVRTTVQASRRRRPQLAATVAGTTAFCVSAAFDWVWQIPVLPVAILLLASALVTAAGRGRRSKRSRLERPIPLGARLGLAVAAVAALVSISIPLASTALVRQSQTDARAADLSAALSAARGAQNVQPNAATPRLQQALLLEAQGNLAPAAAAARAAAERESTNWRTWLVLSRIEGEQGRASASLRDYRRARSLNPRSPLFAR